MGLFQKNKNVSQLLNTDKKKSFSEKISDLFGRTSISKEELAEEMTICLIESDLGVKESEEVINTLLKQHGSTVYSDAQSFKQDLAELLIKRYKKKEWALKDEKNQFIMMVGVNGSGKTTSISKLIHYYQVQGKSVGVIAADTFRAGAVAQIENWAGKLGVPCVSGKENEDPSSVLVEGCRYYQDHPVDLIIADTAGRLQNKANLMKELEKMVRVTARELNNSMFEIWLVLDGTTGQNGLNQAENFIESSKLTGLILTKMDSTSKGGIALAVNQKYNLPIRFLTYGENIEAIGPFDAEKYINGLLGL